MRRLTQLVLVGVLLLVGGVAGGSPTDAAAGGIGSATLSKSATTCSCTLSRPWTRAIRRLTMRILRIDIRDQTLSRSPTSTAQHEQEGDLFYAELRFGADFRYQKSLTFQLLFENQSVFDGNLIDDRANTSNPGGTRRVWPAPPSTENPGFRVERFWARYKFAGHPRDLARRGRS